MHFLGIRTQYLQQKSHNDSKIDGIKLPKTYHQSAIIKVTFV